MIGFSLLLQSPPSYRGRAFFLSITGSTVATLRPFSKIVTLSYYVTAMNFISEVVGALFGFGERAGNTDLLILALNLFSEGIDPCLDLSDIMTIRATVEECTGYRIHERHPYAGDLVFKTFAGSHQDAIRKTLRRNRPSWNIPNLIIDPSDIGRKDEEIIGINSQSGSSAVSYILKKYKNIVLHKDICSRTIKKLKRIDVTEGREIRPETIYSIAERYISSRL